jgi:ribosomal protein S14
MQRSIKKDYNKRKKFILYENRIIILKSLLSNIFLDVQMRNIIQILFLFLGKKTSFVKIHNRCLLTGKGRSIIRFLGLSRNGIHYLFNLGKLPGYIKN